MNPADPPPPLIQPHRPSVSSTTCDLHPDEIFTGFCPLCLFERLTVLDHSSSLRKPETTTASSSTAAAIKAIFKGSAHASSSTTTAARASDKSNAQRSKPSFFPELRRTKSFSASKGEGFSGVFEPQRKSCDVKVRSTLWTLFNQDDQRKGTKKEVPTEIEVHAQNLGCSSSTGVVRDPVVNFKEEEEEEIEEEEEEGSEIQEEDEVDEIRVSVEQHYNVMNVVEDRIDEIVEEAIEEEISQAPVEVKTIKDHINLHSQSKKVSGRDFKEIAGSFWSAASVFSKKLQKWRRNQKMKKHRNGARSSTLPVEKPIGRHYRETQSEIADYGFGRRSCDTDPRFSLDAGRISFDDPRYSFDEPRASWDGYLIGKTFPRLTPMLSVVEDTPVHHVPRSDTQIQVEQPRISINGDDTIPGGSVQTRDYYSDSSSKRRSSVDRSNSIRKMAAAVVAEIDEMKSISNIKISPEFRDSNSNLNPLRDDRSDSFKSSFRENASVISNGEKKESSTKKSRRWTKPWNIWSLIHWRGGVKDEEDDKFRRSNGIDRSFSESWQDFPSQQNGDSNGGFNRKMFRSNSSVSWRNSNSVESSSFTSSRKSNAETAVLSKKRRDEFALDRNRSARFSPNHVDNGLLRFYLTPSWRSASNGHKNRPNNAHSIARSVLRLY